MYVCGLLLSQQEIRQIFYGEDVKEVLSHFIGLGLYKYYDMFYGPSLILGYITDGSSEKHMDDLMESFVHLDLDNTPRNNVKNRLPQDVLESIRNLYPELLYKDVRLFYIP